MTELEEIETKARTLVERRYRDGLHAIEMLMKSLSGSPLPEQNMNGLSNVDRVLDAISGHAKDNNQICIDTGLDPIQVSDVLYSKNVENRIQFRRVDGRLTYQKIQIRRKIDLS